MKKIYLLSLTVLLVSGCTFFQRGELRAENGRTHMRHVVGFGWNSDNYFYFGDQASHTDTDISGSADFSTNGK